MERRFTVSVVLREWPGREIRRTKLVVDAKGVQREVEELVSYGPVRQLGAEYAVTARDEASVRVAMAGILGAGISLDVVDEGPAEKPLDAPKKVA